MATREVSSDRRLASRIDLGEANSKIFSFIMGGFLYVPALTEGLVKGANQVVEKVYVEEKRWLPRGSKVLVLDKGLRGSYSYVAVSLPLSKGWGTDNWLEAGADDVVATLRLFRSDPETDPPVLFPLEEGGHKLPAKLEASRYETAELSRFAVRPQWRGKKASLGLYRAAYVMSQNRFSAWVMTANWKVIQLLWMSGIYPIVLSGPRAFYGEEASIFCYMPIADVAAALKWVNPPGYEIFTGKPRESGPESSQGRAHVGKAVKSVYCHLGFKGLQRMARMVSRLPLVRAASLVI